MSMKRFRVLGEQVLAVIRKTDNYMLVETETVFYILVYDVENEKWIAVQGFSKMEYDVNDVIKEFEDFVNV